MVLMVVSGNSEPSHAVNITFIIFMLSKNSNLKIDLFPNGV
jgi:hypothetical protein